MLIASIEMLNAGDARSKSRSHKVRIIVHYSIARTLEKSLGIEVIFSALTASNGQSMVVCLDYSPLPSGSTALRVSLLQLPHDDWQ